MNARFEYGKATMDEYDSEVRRRLCWHRWQFARELLEGVAILAFSVVLAWTYLKITPDQFSAEADMTAEAER